MKTLHLLLVVLLYVVCLAVIYPIPLGATELPDEPVEIRGETQFFVDDYIVDNRWALRMGKEAMVRVVHQPVKHSEALIPGRGGYVNVVRDEEAGLYRMIYQDFWVLSPKPDYKFTYAFAYAESDDGIKWRIPDLGLYGWKESGKNNICFRGPKDGRVAGPFLVELPEEQRRGYKFTLLYKGTDGVHLIGSNDCIHWDHASDVRIAHRFWPDTQSSVVWDPKRKEYVWFTRATNRYGGGGSRNPLDGGATRRVARLANGELWTEWTVSTQNIIIPDAEDAREGFNFIYGMPTRYHAGIYWGFSWPFKLNTDIYTELMISRNGRVFEKLPGSPRLIDLGAEGSWDVGMVFGSPNWVEVDDVWRIYYGGHDGPHNSRERKPGIGMATIRKEGFVSLRGPKGGGVVCTRAILWPGGGLEVNCDATQGELKVRVSTEKREPIPGFDYEDCVVFKGDDTAARVTWKEKEMEVLKGKVIRLEFFLTNADIYTFRAKVGGE